MNTEKRNEGTENATGRLGRRRFLVAAIVLTGAKTAHDAFGSPISSEAMQSSREHNPKVAQGTISRVHSSMVTVDVLTEGTAGLMPSSRVEARYEPSRIPPRIGDHVRVDTNDGYVATPTFVAMEGFLREAGPTGVVVDAKAFRSEVYSVVRRPDGFRAKSVPFEDARGDLTIGAHFGILYLRATRVRELTLVEAVEL